LLSTRVVKNYSTPIGSRVLAILELLGTALLICGYNRPGGALNIPMT